MDEIRSASQVGTLYFPTDSRAIWLNGQEVANSVMSQEEAEMIREGQLPALFFDFTAFDSLEELTGTLSDYLTVGESFTKGGEGSALISGASDTIILRNIKGGTVINVSTNTANWPSDDAVYKVSEIIREGRKQIKYEFHLTTQGDVTLRVPANAKVYSISLYTNYDAVHERIDRLEAKVDA
ncbi:MAG: hypothetical protein Q4A08_09710, partial [Bacteroidales bacterium]|nr:hypothetical protein [Bacteroidales bacterium]